MVEFTVIAPERTRFAAPAIERKSPTIMKISSENIILGFEISD